ncbi:MAG TPA: serine/threonine-protein kinase [Kofleriaceae bacterium]|nr:serine/threonine-protein kinase [Kofleriaceae bacterium]
MDKPTRPADPLGATSLGEAAAIGRIEKALFGGGDRLVNVGRYAIRELIGAGAFGKVYRARDPELDRDVALKVLTVDDVEADRAALLAEARVMAALGHPNVAAVHDAGIVDDRGRTRVFIAMELVDGASLRAWLETPRPPAATLDVLRQAGRGLAAAHAAGIVHRDFKPDNVLVGRDGRVRVVDFGLARSVAVPSGDGSSLAGTPAYMAPEQLAGGAATERTDQFAYAVTAWEALHGERPFAGATLDAIRDAMTRPPVGRRRVASTIGRALARGLAIDPEARWPSVAALVDALEPRHARWIVPAALAAVAGAGLVVGISASRSHDAGDPCPVPRDQLAGIWDPARRAQIEQAFAATKAPFAADSFARVAAALDRDAQSWLDAQVDACRATHVRHVQSTELLDRRAVCLADWRRRLRAATEAFATATPAIVQQSVQTIADLPSLAACGDVAALATGQPALDPAQRTRADALADRLAAARGKLIAAQPADATTIVDEVSRDPLATKHAPLAIAVALLRAEAATALGKLDDAQTAAQAAFDAAVSSGDRRSAAAAATLIAKLGVYDTRRKADALRWVKTGATITRELDGATELAARLASVEGNVQLINADAPAAAEPLARAVAAYRTLDPNHPQLGNALAMLGVSELGRGDIAAADRDLRDALARDEAALGPRHPDVASVLAKLALVEAARGHYADALATGQRAIDLQRAVWGPNHPLLIYAYGSHGQHAAAHGDYAAADADFTAAQSIAEASYGPDHPMVAQLLLVHADLDLRRGALAEATAFARRGRDLVAKTADDRDLGLAYANVVLARALATGGAPAHRAEALPLARDAVRRCDAFPQGLPSGPCAIVYQYAAAVLDDASSVPLLEKAAHAIESGTPDPIRLAELRWQLGVRRRDPALVQRALAEFPRDGDPSLKATISR